MPLHWLVWDYVNLREAERVDDLIDESHRQRTAVLNTMAFHKPALLNGERLALNARVRSLVRTGSTRGDDPEQLREYGRSLIEAIEQSGAFNDTPVGLVS